MSERLLSSLCGNANIFAVRPSLRRVGNEFRRGPGKVSFGKIEELVALGEKVKQLKWKRRQRKDQFRALCETFRKDVKRHMEFGMASWEDEKADTDLLTVAKETDGFEVESEEYAKGKRVFDIKFVVTLQ